MYNKNFPHLVMLFTDNCPGKCSCDNSNQNSHKQDWKGTNWYKMIDPAGSKIPEHPVDSFRCGTNYPGTVNQKFFNSPG